MKGKTSISAILFLLGFGAAFFGFVTYAQNNRGGSLALGLAGVAAVIIGYLMYRSGKNTKI